MFVFLPKLLEAKANVMPFVRPWLQDFQSMLVNCALYVISCPYYSLWESHHLEGYYQEE